MTGGQKAAEMIDHTFQHLSPDCTARQAADQMTANIRSVYVQHDILSVVEAQPERRMTASMVALSLHRREIWSIGDCQFMLEDERFTVKKKVDEVPEEARAFFIAAELMAQRTTVEALLQHDTGRDFTRALNMRQSQFQNNPDAGEYYYATVDGFDILDQGIRIHPIPDHVTHVVLASDGYPYLMPSLAASEQRLAELLERDPLLYQAFKSTKGLVAGNLSFDDRAYVKVRLC